MEVLSWGWVSLCQSPHQHRVTDGLWTLRFHYNNQGFMVWARFYLHIWKKKPLKYKFPRCLEQHRNQGEGRAWHCPGGCRVHTLQNEPRSCSLQCISCSWKASGALMHLYLCSTVWWRWDVVGGHGEDGLRLNLGILEAFSDLKGSVTLWPALTSCSAAVLQKTCITESRSYGECALISGIKQSRNTPPQDTNYLWRELFLHLSCCNYLLFLYLVVFFFLHGVSIGVIFCFCCSFRHRV